MKKVLIRISAIFTLLLAFASCNEKYITYEGAGFISFSDSLYVFPVLNDTGYYNVPIISTEVCDYDRNVAVEVVYSKTNAKERYHYNVESHTLTIPAGEQRTSLRLQGKASHIDVADSLGVNLRILSDGAAAANQIMSTDVILRKTCPFNIELFTGYCKVTSPVYMKQYMQNKPFRLVKSEIDPKNENTIILKDYFYDGFDVRLRFTTDDLLNPLVEMDDQKFATTAQAFGTVHGDGIIRMEEMKSLPSYYSSCESFLIHYVTLYVPEVGVIGKYGNLIEWITDDEAEKIMREERL